MKIITPSFNGLPLKQKRAWIRHLRRHGACPENYEMLFQHLYPEFHPGKLKEDKKNGHGGYTKIPQALITKAANDIGLLTKEIPKVIVKKDCYVAYIHRYDSGKIVVVIPRREPKREVISALRHEFAHHKLGHWDYEEMNCLQKLREEIEANRLAGEHLNADLLYFLMIGLIIEEKYTYKETIAALHQAAREMNIRKEIVAQALKSMDYMHFGNYLDRYALR